MQAVQIAVFLGKEGAEIGASAASGHAAGFQQLRFLLILVDIDLPVGRHNVRRIIEAGQAGTRRGRLGQGELIDRIGLDIIAPVQAHLDVVGARHKATVRHHIECLISRKLQVIQGCIVHLQHHCRDRGAALALCGIVRLHHIPRAVVGFAVLARVGVHQLGAGGEGNRGAASVHNGLDGVIIHLLKNAGLCLCQHAQRGRHAQHGGIKQIQLCTVGFRGFVQIDRIGYHRFSHEIYSFQVLTYFMQTLPFTTTKPQDSSAATRARMLV